MAKSKKNKQADFQKVKLKVGKRLPKGQNVTNTSFKTRSIQVVQQIKADGSQPSTHRKLNITDLLSKCQHYSISVRHEGVTGLRELMISFPALMTSHLSLVIEKTLPLIMDKDNNIRQATLKLFNFIFPNTPTNRIEPFFPVVSAHLCCAMTHIYDEIQHDSLELFDVLLETYPLLIANNSGQLLENFIEQISRQQNISKKGQSSNLSLAVKPDSRFSVQRWRSGILSRVFKLLSALLTWRFPDSSKMDKESQSHVYKACSSVPLQFSSSVASAWTLPGHKIQSSTAKSLITSTKGDNLTTFASSLIPLLVQCWMECRSSQGQGKTQDSLVWPGSVSVMYHIMRVLHLLWLCVDRENQMADTMTETSPAWDKHQKEFVQQFMTHFPYSLQESLTHKGKKNKKTAVTVSAEALNLSICEVMICLVTSQTQDDRRLTSVCSSVGEYLCACLDMKHLSSELNKTMVNVLRQFFAVCPDVDLVETVLEKAVTRYNQAHPLSTEKRLYLELFTSLFLDTNTQLAKMTSLMDQFFQSLPELLPLVYRDNTQMAALIVRVMRQAACQNCLPLLNNLQNNFLDFLDVDGGLFISSDESLQIELLDTLYWVPNFNTELLRRLVNACHHGNVSISKALYLLDIVHNRFQMEIESETQNETGVAMTTSYMSFLLSVLSGGGKDNLEMEVDKQDGRQVTSAPSLMWNVTSEKWQKHFVIVKRVCYHLLQLPDIAGLSVVIWAFWKRLLLSSERLHITTVSSFLMCLTTFKSCDKSIDRSFVESVGNLSLSVAIEMVTMAPTDDHMSQVTNQLWECLTQSLVAGPSFINSYFKKAKDFLQSCNQETCLAVLTSTVHILQDQPINGLPQTVGGHLESIQNIVKNQFLGAMETQQWKDFLYCQSLVCQHRNVNMSQDSDKL